MAVVLPYSMFKNRDYRRIISQSAMKLDGSTFEEMFDLSPYLEMVQPIPAPIEVLGKICDIVTNGKRSKEKCVSGTISFFGTLLEF